VTLCHTCSSSDIVGSASRLVKVTLEPGLTTGGRI
jgi:hypothetical protein